MDEIVQPELPVLPILYKDDRFVVIHKPPGLHVHQPEMARRRVARELTILYILRKQIEEFLYPVHRLDVATEGVLLMALKSEVARDLQADFQSSQVQKVYHAVCRGWMDDEGRIDMPLERDSNGTLADAVTNFRTLARVECPFPIGKRYQTARYTLVEARPETGRWHQIRRHFARSTHPIVGDREHGDSHHNRYFREVLGNGGLWLRASQLTLQNGPTAGQTFTAPVTDRWTKMCEQLGFDKGLL